jgi:small nuclear ribonucleoprotein (snRNP)-like protein
MKIFRSLFLAGVLIFGAGAIAQDKPAPIVEYDLGSCGGRDFTVEHVVIDKNAKTIAFDYFMPSPDQVQKNTDMLVMTDYKETVSNNDVVFEAKLDYTDPDEKKLYHFGLKGVIRGQRAIAVFAVNGKIGRLYYGQLGKVDDMVKVVLDRASFCDYLHTARDSDDLIEKLNGFLNASDDTGAK